MYKENVLTYYQHLFLNFCNENHGTVGHAFSTFFCSWLIQLGKILVMSQSLQFYRFDTSGSIAAVLYQLQCYAIAFIVNTASAAL